jgi:hypothetical protein
MLFMIGWGMRIAWLAMVFLILAGMLLVSTPAEAHRPYAAKIKMLEGPSGEPLILERLFGDGIFFADPVSLQVRNKKGAVIAWTPTAGRVAVFCPSIQFCWTFPYGILSPLAQPFKLAHEKLDYSKEGDVEEYKELSSYLTDDEVKRVGSYRFPYPEKRKDNAGFTPDGPIALLLSPVVMLVDHAAAYAVLAILLPPLFI